MTEPELIYSAWKTPDGTILHSKHRHDYVEHFDSKSKEVYALDGGCEYVRCTINKVPPVNLSVYSNAPHEEKRKVFFWGSRGADGVQPLVYNALMNLETSHIKAIIKTQTHLPEHIMQMFEDELQFRSNSDS